MSEAEQSRLPRSPGPITSCTECEALVHQVSLPAHQQWHSAINARIRGKQDLR